MFPNMRSRRDLQDFARISEDHLLHMSSFFNVGSTDRLLRLLLGVGLGVSAIFVDGHPYARWGLALLGISVILSGTCGI
jgi:hypothetical protein